MVGLRITITGNVHGVGFRWFAKQVADNLGLSGWVKNYEDGSVLAYVEGDFYKLGLFSDAMGKGPIDAKVDSINIKKTEEEGLNGFEIKR